MAHGASLKCKCRSQILFHLVLNYVPKLSIAMFQTIILQCKHIHPFLTNPPNFGQARLPFCLTFVRICLYLTDILLSKVTLPINNFLYMSEFPLTRSSSCTGFYCSWAVLAGISYMYRSIVQLCTTLILIFPGKYLLETSSHKKM